MHFRKLALFTCLLLPAVLCGCARETPAEHAAGQYAERELAAAPPHGNIPDYSLPPAALARAQSLSRLRTTLHFTGLLAAPLELILLLWSGAVARMRDLAVRVGRRYREREKPARAAWREGFVLAFLLTLAITLLNLPLSMFGHHESVAYGFSVQGWASWFADYGKTFLLTWLTTASLFLLFFWAMRRFPRRWWLVTWAVMAAASILVLFITPLVVDPLYNQFEPLGKTHPELVERLEQVAERGHMNIPPERMFLMRASAKVTTINAYVTGFGSSERLVLWDTALAKLTPDELLLVFGHECGHYVLHHLVNGILMTIVGMLQLAFLAFHFINWFRRVFGARLRLGEGVDWGLMVVLALFLALANIVGEPFYQGISRMQEHAADVYGQEAVHGIVADPQKSGRGSFAVLGANTYDDPNPSPLMEFWTYSHPATGRRAAFAHVYDPWAPGMEPKYFGKQ